MNVGAFQRSRAKYSLATISAYGPDTKRATKLVVGILRRAAQKEANPLRSWSADASDVRNDPLIAAELADWLHGQGIKDTVSYDRIGCSVDRTTCGARLPQRARTSKPSPSFSIFVERTTS